MTAARNDAPITSSAALIAALDANDIEAIEAALPALRRSVETLKAPGGPSWAPGLRDQVQQALGVADSARARIRYLTDRTQQRIDMLATAAGRFDCTPATYTRP